MKRCIINRIKLSFDSLPENEKLARNALVVFLAGLDPDLEELTDLRTAVSEAVTNAIIHGYRVHPGTVTLSAILYADRHVTIRIIDKGQGIADIAQAMQPLYTTDPPGERGGMGFAIMESFTDKLIVRSRPGKGTSVTMIKRFHAKALCADDES